MPTASETLFALEDKFWRSMVDQKTDVALKLLCEPAFMVSPHGSMQFDHASYRKMAEQGSMTVTSYALSDMQASFPTDDVAILSYKAHQVLKARDDSREKEQDMLDTSTWVRDGGTWKCVMHTESPAPDAARA